MQPADVACVLVMFADRSAIQVVVSSCADSLRWLAPLSAHYDVLVLEKCARAANDSLPARQSMPADDQGTTRLRQKPHSHTVLPPGVRRLELPVRHAERGGAAEEADLRAVDRLQPQGRQGVVVLAALQLPPHAQPAQRAAPLHGDDVARRGADGERARLAKMHAWVVGDKGRGQAPARDRWRQKARGRRKTSHIGILHVLGGMAGCMRRTRPWGWRPLP